MVMVVGTQSEADMETQANTLQVKSIRFTEGLDVTISKHFPDFLLEQLC